jgi:hypothetical protein
MKRQQQMFIILTFIRDRIIVRSVNDENPEVVEGVADA